MNIEDKKKLGKVIRMYRKNSRMTQEILAKNLGLSTKYIQYIENGNRSPSLKTVYKIAKILKTDACHLFCPESLIKK